MKLFNPSPLVSLLNSLYQKQQKRSSRPLFSYCKSYHHLPCPHHRHHHHHSGVHLQTCQSHQVIVPGESVLHPPVCTFLGVHDDARSKIITQTVKNNMTVQTVNLVGWFWKIHQFHFFQFFIIKLHSHCLQKINITCR